VENPNETRKNHFEHRFSTIFIESRSNYGGKAKKIYQVCVSERGHMKRWERNTILMLEK
jgi:hypothetical protein